MEWFNIVNKMCTKKTEYHTEKIERQELFQEQYDSNEPADQQFCKSLPCSHINIMEVD